MGGRSDPRTYDECAAESERADANKADKRGSGTAEGRGADMGNRLTGASAVGARGAGRGKGAANPGRRDRDAIVG